MIGTIETIHPNNYKCSGQAKMEDSQLTLKSEIIPFCRYFQIFGLQYFSLDSPSKKVSFKYKFFFMAFLGLLISSSIGQVLTFSSTLFQSIKDTTKDKVQENFERVSYFGINIAASVILFQSFLKTLQNQKVFENFGKIYSLLWHRLFLKIDYHPFKIEFGKKFILLLIFSYGTYATPMGIELFNFKTVTFQRLSRMFPIFLTKCLVIKFIFYANLVNFHLKIIENLLTTQSIDKDGFNSLVNIGNLKKHPQQVVNKNEQLIERVLVAKQIYSLIWETTQLINDCLGWTILALIIL